jgi:hypothetical protein
MFYTIKAIKIAFRKLVIWPIVVAPIFPLRALEFGQFTQGPVLQNILLA